MTKFHNIFWYFWYFSSSSSAAAISSIELAGSTASLRFGFHQSWELYPPGGGLLNLDRDAGWWVGSRVSNASGFYLRAIVISSKFRTILRNTRTVAHNSAQFRATEFRLETLVEGKYRASHIILDYLQSLTTK